MRITAIAFFVLTLALAVLPAAAQFPINTTFMDSNSAGWIINSYAGSNFTPCLTSGNATCGNDPVGQGWLRLTDNVAQANGEAGYAYFDTAFPSSQGFAIDFEYVSWGGTGADGIGVILFDGSTTAFNVGAPGGSFGYASDYNNAGCSYQGLKDPGLSNGFLGFALDEFGNFQNPGDRCKVGGPGAVPESISVRGPGNGANDGTNYQFIAGTAGLTPSIDSPGGTTRPSNTTYYRHVIIYVTPNADGTLTYTVKWMTSLFGSFSTVLTGTTGVIATPATLKLGFTASTGGSTNYHEVRNVKVSYPADLAVTKTHTGGATPGSTVTYTMTVTNHGPVNVVGATFTDPVPATVTGVTWTCAVAGTGACSVASGSGNAISLGLDLNSGSVATITATGTLAGTTPLQVINTATVTPPSNITDTDPNNNSASDVIDIGSPAATMTISKTATSTRVRNGHTDTFVIVVGNSAASTATATGVTVTDTVPNAFSATGVTATTTQGSCTVVGLAVSCALGTMPVGAAATITITATAASNNTNFTNTAVVTNNEGSSATASVSGRVANTNSVTDLAVTKTHAPSGPSAGNPVTYTMVVTNNGGTTVTGAVLTDVVPPSVTVGGWSCAPTAACTPANGATSPITPSITLAAGASVTVTATGTIAQGAPSLIVNAAAITAPAGWDDTNSLNNVAIDEISLSVPVTVARFLATTEPDGVRFRWTSAIEASNVGYNLYAQTARGLVRLNQRLIPSRAPDSTVPVAYEEFVPGAPSGPYVLEDVDILTGVRRHGPFAADREYGAEPAAEPIDWHAVRTAALRVRATGFLQDATLQQVNVLVDHDGLYRVTYESLKGAGFDLAGIPVQQLALTCRGAAVPILVVGPGSLLGDSPARPFGPGVAVEFIGQAVDSLYTHTNVYTLARSMNAAARIALDGTPVPAGQPPQYYMETTTVTKPMQYSFASPTGSPWYESGILAYTTPVSQTFTVPVDNLAEGAGGAQFFFHMWGGTDWPDANPDHHAVLSLNGRTVADDTFNGVTDHPVSGPLPDGAVVDGANVYTLTLPGDSGVAYEIVNVTGYGLTYPRRFVARNGALSFTSDGSVLAVDGLTSADLAVYRLGGAVPHRVTQVQVLPSATAIVARFAGTGTAAPYLVCDASAVSTPTYAAVAKTTQTRNGYADYLIIAHPDFIAGLAPLVQARTDQGLRVKVVNVNDVYAAFNYGIVDPQAIHDYIAYAYRSMHTRYVLLVGGDTYDYFDDLHTGSISFIPTPYAPTGDLIKYAPADPLLADVDGDGVPDLAIGRLPVRTPAELATVIAKTLAYPGHGSAAAFAADAADNGYSFKSVSDQLAAALPSTWSVTRAYIDDLGVTAARSALIGAINAGAAFTSFVGHSGFTEWSFANLFTAADATALLNTGRPTVVTQWGCWNTYYVEPHNETLAHTLLLAGPQGAAAVLGPATLSEAGSEEGLGHDLMPLLFQPGMPIGTALTLAKQQLARTRPQAIDVIRGWTLLGDPALVVAPALRGQGLAIEVSHE